MELFFLFKKSENFTDARQWMRTGTRFLSEQSSTRVKLTVALGLALSCGAFAMAWHWEQALRLVKFRTFSDDVTAALQRDIDDHLAVLQHLSNYYAAGAIAPGDRQDWRANPSHDRRFVRGFLSRMRGIESLGWMPRVFATDRQSLEAEMRALGYPSFRIREENSQEIKRMAARREEYFPIAYLEGLGNGEMAVGFDAGASSGRFALEQARKSGEIAISSQLPQALPKNGNVDFLAIRRIEVFHSPPSGEKDDPDAEISGFVLGIFNLAEILKLSLEKQNSFPAALANSANIVFYSGSATRINSAAGSSQEPEPQFLAFYDARTGRLSADSTLAVAAEATATGAIARALRVGNEVWTVKFLPEPAYWTTQPHFGAWAALVLGFFSTGILAVSQHVGQLRSLDREQLSRQREQAIAALKQSNASLSQANAEMKLLMRLSNSLQACLTQEEACTTIGKFMRKLFPNFSGALYVTSAAGNLVEASVTWGEHSPHQLVFSPDECWGMRYGQPYIYKNTHSSFACQHGNHPLPEESLCLPLVAHGETLGLLYLSSPVPGRLSDDKQHLAKSVSEQVALALANLKLRETLKYNSIRDPLTNLFNRRYMEEFLIQELYRAQRAGDSVGVVMLDVDHFKRFNDTFGHKAGDEVLRSLGAFLLSSIRASDIACRYGGEEFTLILPEASVEVTRERAEYLRQEVQQRFASNLDLGCTVTISLGVASFPQHGSTAEAILSAADAALYRAKAEGRDRVVTAA